MKTKRPIKRLFHWLSRRSIFFITCLLFATIIFLILYLITGSSFSNDRIIIGIAAVSAFLAAISAIATLLQSVEIQRQRENQERPYVTAYFDGASNGAVYFIIENAGNSPALNVSVEIDPPPVDFTKRPLNKVSLFSNPITFMPSGKVFRQIIDAGYRFLEEGKPTKFKVAVEYLSIFGDSYDETIEHDLEYLKQATVPGKTTEDHLKKISDDIEKLTQFIHNAQGFDSFIVETPTEHSTRMKLSKGNHVEIYGIKKILRDVMMWLASKLNNN
jgi:hypothetical protein